MKDSLASRVSRIITGSARKIVDILESQAPEIVMEEAIHEIDSAIYDVRSELGKVAAAKHLATTRLADANKKHSDLTDKIELAIDSGRDDLAEAAVAQQMDLEAQIPVIELSISESAEKEKELESFISALQGKKREMREELRELRKAKAESTSALSAGAEGNSGNVEDKVARAEAAFDRIVEKSTGLASTGKTSLDNAAQLAELEELSRKNRIKERLAQIKANKEK